MDETFNQQINFMKYTIVLLVKIPYPDIFCEISKTIIQYKKMLHTHITRNVGPLVQRARMDIVVIIIIISTNTPR